MNETRVVTKRYREHPEDSFTIERYLATGGYQALEKAIKQQAPEEIVEMVKASGLRGRGGAGFPTGAKWGFLPKDVFPRYVVVNDDEGEPCTFKDRELSEGDPHAIVEGALICAYAIQAEAVYIYVRGEFALGMRRIERAVEEATSRGFAGDNIFGSGFSCPVYVHPGAGAYICGEETALLESLEGYRGQPRMRPPFFPAVKGLYHQPTVVNNVETLATLPHIISGGLDSFRSIGTEKSPGPKVFSVSGTVRKPGNYEVPLGTPLKGLLELAGGLNEGAALKGVIPGGASSVWFGDVDIAMDFDTLAEAGTILGSGAVTFMDTSVCMVRMALVTARFFNHESCGKCTPCREGTWWGVKVLERLEHGEGRDGDVDLLVEVCDRICEPSPRWVPGGKCFCLLGDSCAYAVRSAVTLFREEFETHERERACPFELAPAGAPAGVTA